MLSSASSLNPAISGAEEETVMSLVTASPLSRSVSTVPTIKGSSMGQSKMQLVE